MMCSRWSMSMVAVLVLTIQVMDKAWKSSSGLPDRLVEALADLSFSTL